MRRASPCTTSGTELGNSVMANAAGSTPVGVDIADSSATGYVADLAFDQAHVDLYDIGARRKQQARPDSARTSVTVPASDVPASVPQAGGTGDVIDSSDTRLTQAVAVTDPATGHEGIWTQHTIAGSGQPDDRAQVRAHARSSPSPRQIGTLGGPKRQLRLQRRDLSDEGPYERCTGWSPEVSARAPGTGETRLRSASSTPSQAGAARGSRSGSAARRAWLHDPRGKHHATIPGNGTLLGSPRRRPASRRSRSTDARIRRASSTATLDSRRGMRPARVGS